MLVRRRAPSLLVGLVSSAEVSSRISLSRYHARRDVTRSRGVVLGPLAGSYRSCVRDVVTLVGRSAGLRMCGKVGVWREIIDCVKRDLHELATTSILLSSQLASESDTLSSPRRPRLTTRQKARKTNRQRTRNTMTHK